MKRILNWFKSYGYYYKWHFVFGAFALFLVGLLVFQLFTKVDYDIYMTYAGPENISLEKISDMKHSVSSAMGDDLKSQKLEISIRDILYVNTKLAIEYQQNDLFFSAASNAEAVKLLHQEVSVGESFIYIIDKEQYESIRDNNALASLSEIFGTAPDSALDDYGIVLNKTEFGQFFSCYNSFSDDMILCLRKDTSESALAWLKGKQSAKEAYELHEELFIDIVEFKAPKEQ